MERMYFKNILMLKTKNSFVMRAVLWRLASAEQESMCSFAPILRQTYTSVRSGDFYISVSRLRSIHLKGIERSRDARYPSLSSIHAFNYVNFHFGLRYKPALNISSSHTFARWIKFLVLRTNHFTIRTNYYFRFQTLFITVF